MKQAENEYVIFDALLNDEMSTIDSFCQSMLLKYDRSNKINYV